MRVSQAETRPRPGSWPPPLAQAPARHPDPAVVPADPDTRIDLQEVLDDVYGASDYEDFIDAGQPDLHLSARDAAWARTFVTPTA